MATTTTTSREFLFGSIPFGREQDFETKRLDYVDEGIEFIKKHDPDFVLHLGKIGNFVWRDRIFYEEITAMTPVKNKTFRDHIFRATTFFVPKLESGWEGHDLAETHLFNADFERLVKPKDVHQVERVHQAPFVELGHYALIS